jgi:hypothetical protein
MMTPDRRERLVEIMAAMATDPAAVFALTSEFHAELARTVRSLMRVDGRELTPEDTNDLVMDAALALTEVAGSWRPDGALPWTWAKARIRSTIRATMFGPRPIDPHDIVEADCDVGSRPVGRAEEPDWRGALIAVAAQHRHGNAVIKVLMEDISERNCAVFLQYLVQQDMGDPEPSKTVATMMELTPANVRKIVQRVRARLTELGIGSAA